MDTWYYATTGGQRHGPVPAAELRALANNGTLGARSLVWREGEANWRPLQDFAVELGLPPALPAAAANTIPPPRTGLSGCAIAALVACGGVFAVMVLGILAAIALPAYQDYTLRAQASAAIVQARALQTGVAEALAANDGHCPRNGDEGFGPAESYAGGGLASVTFGKFEHSGLCGLEARIAAPGKAALDGKAIWLEYHADRQAWQCSSEVANKHLPQACRS